MDKFWLEFKTTVFPWIIAALVVLALQYANRLHIESLKAETAGLRQVNAQLSEQVGRMTEFLATQGYVASPFRPPVNSSGHK
jgi:hypothetical protein